MATKTFKIGEYATGGIIMAETTKTRVTIICKDWDTKREISSISVNVSENEAERRLDAYLNDLTTSYYAGKIMEWIGKSVTFENIRGNMNFGRSW